MEDNDASLEKEQMQPADPSNPSKPVETPKSPSATTSSTNTANVGGGSSSGSSSGGGSSSSSAGESTPKTPTRNSSSSSTLSPSHTEERRVLVTIELKEKRLGLYLEPAEADANTGAVLVRFELIDGLPGEAERSGILRPGMLIASINDQQIGYTQFPSIISTLVNCGRPMRVTFRDPDVLEFRDSYRFLRTKLYVEREAEFLKRNAVSLQANDLAWLAYLGELGGKRGTSWGVQRLFRDCLGELAFPLDPAPRLNAVSPIRGKIAGSAVSSSNSTTQDGGSGVVVVDGSSSSSDDLTPVVISIFRRVWAPSSIGVPCPPGLSITLPGDVPPQKMVEKHLDALERLVVNGGIPAAFRPALWWELSGAHAKSALHPPGYYASLTQLTAVHESSYAIAKDIERTFPGHPQFESRTGVLALKRLLLAFSLHNPEIGYCQSINFLAGFLLLLLSEEQAFWVLDCLINEILPPDYYTRKLLGVHIDQRVISHLVGELLPDVSKAYEDAGLVLHLVTAEWFMCCLCTSVPAHTAFRIWDCIFLFGSECLFRVVLSLFHLNRNKILSVAVSSTKASAGIVPSVNGSANSNGGTSKGLTEEQQRAADTVAAAAPDLIPSFRGGTKREALSTFPALFTMLKGMPSNAFDPDELLRTAYPFTKNDISSSLDWRYVEKTRLAKLRQAAKESAEQEQENGR
jgi:hypothetical protein